MSSNTDDASEEHSYEVFCTDCAFETTVDGTVYDALDVADAHRYENLREDGGHFVTTKLAGYAPDGG